MGIEIQKLIKEKPDIFHRLSLAGMKDESIEREFNFAIQSIQSSKDLMKCTFESVVDSVINIANVGLSLNPALQQACLISRWNRGDIYKCTLMPMYQGLAELVFRGGKVIDINTQIVYEADDIQVNLASAINPIIHNVDVFGDRGQIKGVYMVATLSNGIKHPEFMSMKDVELIMGQSEAYKYAKNNPGNQKAQKTPWVIFKGEMMRKTVLKRGQKYLPKGEGQAVEHLANAISLDNSEYPASASQIGFINSLLNNANVEERMMNSIHQEINSPEDVSAHRAKELIKFLKENQLDSSPQYSDPLKISANAKAVEKRTGKKTESKVTADDLLSFLESIKDYGRELAKDLLEAAFGTNSWNEVKKMSWVKLEPGLNDLKKWKIEFDHQIKDKTDSKEIQDMAYHCIQLIFN